MFFIVGERTAAAPNPCVSTDAREKEETAKRTFKDYFWLLGA